MSNPVIDRTIIEYNSDDYLKECSSGGSDKCICDVCVEADERQFDNVMAVIGQRLLNMRGCKSKTYITSVVSGSTPAVFKFQGREYQMAENVGKDYFDAISFYFGDYVEFPIYYLQVVPGTTRDNNKDMQINLRGYDRTLVVLTIKQR